MQPRPELTQQPQAVNFLQMVPLMIRKARAATWRADSYRVQVGATACFDRGTATPKLLARSNDKPTPAYEVRKHCAETKLFKAARARAEHGGPRTMSGLVIVGPANKSVIESITNTATPTLHSCDVCLGAIDFYQQENTLAIADTMPILTTHWRSDMATGQNIFQLTDLAEMRAFHVKGHGYADDLTVEHTYYDNKNFGLLRRAAELAMEHSQLAQQMPPAPFVRQMIAYAS